MTSIKKELLKRLQKILALARDPRGHKKVAEAADRKFKALCKENGIDPKSINPEEDLDCNVGYYSIGKSVIDPIARVCGIMTGICHHEVQISGEYRHGLIDLCFKTKKPMTPDEAIVTFKYIFEHAQRKWETFKQNAEKDPGFNMNQNSMFFLFNIGSGGRGRSNPHLKSFVSGFYHTLGPALEASRLNRVRFRKYVESKAEQQKSAKAALAAPKVKLRKPRKNKYALMCLPKKVVPPPPPKEEVQEQPEQRETMPPEQDPTDWGNDQRPEMDKESYMVGVKAAMQLDINAIRM